MNKKQRIRREVKLAISKEALGAGRTAALLVTRKKYGIGRMSTADMDGLTVYDSYPTNA